MQGAMVSIRSIRVIGQTAGEYGSLWKARLTRLCHCAFALGRASMQAAVQHTRQLRCREPLPSRPLVVVAAAMIGGCVVARLASVSATAWWLAAIGSLALWGWFALKKQLSRATIALCLAIACGSASWFTVRANLFGSNDLAWSLADAAAPVAIEGTVVESFRLLKPAQTDPMRAIVLEPSSECVVAVQAVSSGGVWRSASGRATVIVDGDPPTIIAGSRIRVFGRGVRPSVALNPGEFDFRQAARSLRCLSIVRSRSQDYLRVLEQPAWYSLAAFTDRLRSAGVAVLRAHLSKERAPLGAALLLGSRESLPREESREFLVTGTIHILSISGLHVGILAIALFGVLRTLAVPRGWSLLSVALCTGLYMLLVRAETPVMRATLLVWLACIGAAVGRRSLGINALAVAAIIVLAWHPPELFRIGTQLSFLSTAVLIAAVAAIPSHRQVTDPIERLIDRSRSPIERWSRRHAWQAVQLVLVGTAVWAATAPIVASQFHLVSPVALLLNPLIAPLVSLAMAWGFLCLLVAPFSSLLAGLFGWACDQTLRCIDTMVTAAASLPGAYAWVAGPALWWVVGWYALLLATLFLLPRERLKRIGTWGAVAALWMMVGLVCAAGHQLIFPRAAVLEAIVAAMGHGCGIVVQSPTGQCLVYDAGRLGAPGAGCRALAAVLWSRGIKRIDTLVISHADSDHFNAVPELLKRFYVGKLFVPRRLLESSSPAVGEMLRQVRMAGIPIQSVQAGDSIPLDALCRVRVLHPPPEPIVASAQFLAHSQSMSASFATSGLRSESRASDNATSLVLSIESAGRRLLLTGDIEGEAAARFAAADPDSCDTLLAPHHGTRTSLPPLIARATAPDWVIASGVGGASWPEVRRAYEAAREDGGASTVLKTGGDGAIALTFTAATTHVEQFTRTGWRQVVPTGLSPLPFPFSTATRRPLAAENSRLERQKTLSGHPFQNHRSAGQHPAEN